MSDPQLQQAIEQAESGQLDLAIAALRMRVRLRPKDAQALSLLGSMLQRGGDFQQALHHLQRAVELAPHIPAYRNNYAFSLLSHLHNAQARDQWLKAIELDPTYTFAWIGLSIAYTLTKQCPLAIEAGQRAIALQPEWPGATANYAAALARIGRVGEGIEAIEQLLAGGCTDTKLYSNLLMLLHCSERTTEQIAASHRAFASVCPTQPQPPTPLADPLRTLRIGILSGDLADHSVAFFSQALMRHRQPDARMIVFSSSVPMKHDAFTQQHKSQADAWFDVAALDDRALDALIRQQRIDILIELSGHTEANRLTALNAKPAPIIISAIGYPNTTGHPCIDFRLVDSITDPPGSEHLCTEKLMRLHPCLLCYTPWPESPAPAMPAPGTPITFCSFNVTGKISANTIGLWRAVLKVLPHSRLLLKSQSMSDPAARAMLLERFVAADIAASRLDMIDYSQKRHDHLNLYSRAHISLDTTPPPPAKRCGKACLWSAYLGTVTPRA